MLFQYLLYCSKSCTSPHFKVLKSYTKTFKIRPYMFRSSLKPSLGGPWPYFSRLLNFIDLFRLCLIVSSKVSRVVFIHLVYNSALLLTSCCCSILVTCRSQFDLYFHSSSSTLSTVQSLKAGNPTTGPTSRRLVTRPRGTKYLLLSNLNVKATGRPTWRNVFVNFALN